jgi:AcrR family transcriptional regulator
MENNERNRIVEAALELGKQQSWEAVRLHAVAEATGISLNKERLYFREKEDLVDAWFDRADSAMLQEAEAPDFQELSPRQRLHRLIMTWLATLAPHRNVTRQMIYGKMELGHVHIQIPGLMRVSRTVQWIREAAHLDATHVRRALEETGLTSIYLMTFFYWMKDNTPNSEKTSCFLDGLLGTTEKLDQLLCVGICSVTAKETTSSMPIKQTGSTQPKKLAKKNQKLP